MIRCRETISSGRWIAPLSATSSRRHFPPVSDRRSLPAGFRQQLHSAIVRSGMRDSAAMAAALEREHEAQLAELRNDYVRLRQRTLGTLIGVAFAAGLLINFALP